MSSRKLDYSFVSGEHAISIVNAGRSSKRSGQIFVASPNRGNMTCRKGSLTFAVALIALLACIPFTAYGQTSLGTIQGVVQDQTHAVIPGVEVVARHLSTNRNISATSSSSGTYFIPGLPVGAYQLSVEQPGFAKFSQEPVVVSTGSSLTVNNRLHVGDSPETGSVQGRAGARNTPPAEVGTVIEHRALQDLPLSISGLQSVGWGSMPRQIDEFIYLVPGVSQLGKYVNGSPATSQEILIDGASAMSSEIPGQRVNQYAPPYEAVEEFKVHTADYSAEFGRGFGVMNFTLKSGTNKFHGDAFEFLRNEKLDARGFFVPVRAPKKQNEYGGTAGGPVLIPKLYNGKDKTFFFFAYTGFKVRGADANLRIFTIPTLRERQGDFGERLQSFGTQIFDPDSTQPDGKGNFVRTPFANSQIPKARWSRISTQLNDMLPPPQFPTITNNYVSNEREHLNQYNWSLKIDHSITANHKIFASVFPGKQTSVGYTGVDGPWDPEELNGFNSIGARLGYDFIISPTLLNHFSGGVSRNYGGRITDPASGFDPFKIPGIPTNVQAFPQFIWSGYRSVGNTNGQPSVRADTNINLMDTVTYVRGKHQFKGGFSFQGWRANQLETINEAGTFWFRTAETSQPNDPVNFSKWGNGYASGLLGQVDQFLRLAGGFVDGGRVYTAAWFVEDTWKITPKLTLSLGLRHELPFTLREVEDRMSMFDPGATNPANGRPGALVFAGNGPGRIGRSRFADSLLTRHFGPHLSMAYQVNSKTVFRTGYGIIYAPGNATVVGRMTTLFKQGFSYTEGKSTPDGISSIMKLDGGFQPFDKTLPLLDPTLGNGQTVEYMNPDAGKMPYMQQWNVSIQRELPQGVLLDLDYVGTKGTNVAWGGENINQLDPKYLSLGSLLTANINSPDARAANIPIPYAGFTGSVAQALRPFPHIQTIRDLMQPTGSSTYHALQVKAQRRFSAGYHFLLSYTLSKSIANVASEGGLADTAADSGMPRNTFNRKLDKSISAVDQTHNFVLSGGYELPFGVGKPLLNNAGAVNKVVGGWTLAAIARYASGVPLSIGGGSQLNLFGGSNRPNRLQDVPMTLSFADPATDRYLNMSAFANSAPYTFGTAGIMIPQVRGFPILNEDLSLLKRTTITEGNYLELRVEAFNIFNRVQFRNPSASVNDPANFGRIASQANLASRVQLGLKFVF